MTQATTGSTRQARQRVRHICDVNRVPWPSAAAVVILHALLSKATVVPTRVPLNVTSGDLTDIP